jgi:hypothetical protein
MLRKFFTFFILSLCVIAVGCGKKRQELCTDAPVMELASAKFGKHHGTYMLLKKLQKDGYVSQEYSPITHSQFVETQYLFESAIASMAKYNQILRVVGVIYTPLPSTPLRIDGNNINLLLTKEQINKPEIVDTIVARYESLHEFLRSGSTLYNIHQPLKTSIPGINTYNSNLRVYSKNLQDVVTNKFNKDFIGASYLVECKDGTRVMFAILSHQVSEENPRTEWQLFYGNIDNNEKLYNQFITLQNIYKEQEIEFDLN